MNFKTLMNLGLLSGAMFFASCGDSPNVEETKENNALVELEDQAFQQEVSEEEVKLENYIKNLNAEIESADVENVEELKAAKTEAVNMLLKLRSEFIKLTDESAAKWVVFQAGIDNLIKISEKELNYAQEMDDDNSDS